MDNAAGKDLPANRRVPWLEDLNNNICWKAVATLIDRETYPLQIKSRVSSVPFRELHVANNGYLGNHSQPIEELLCDMFTISNGIHFAADRSEHRFWPDDLPESSEHFIANMRKGLPLLHAYKINIKGEERSGRRPSVPFACFASNDVMECQLSSSRAISMMKGT